MAILHVDDHPALRDVVRQALAAHGFEVLSADGVASAKRALEGRDDVTGGLFDVGLPDGSGADLYDWLVASRPTLVGRVAFVTGGGGGVPVARLAATGCVVLEKPFALSDLVRLAAEWEGRHAPHRP